MADRFIQPLETRFSISIISTINPPLKLSRDYLLLVLLCSAMTNLPPQLSGLKCELCDMPIFISWWKWEQGSAPADPIWNLTSNGHRWTARKRKRSHSPTGSWLSHRWPESCHDEFYCKGKYNLTSRLRKEESWVSYCSTASKETPWPWQFL